MAKLLDLLADLGDDEEAFAARHLQPALLLEPWGGDAPRSHVDTPSGPFATRSASSSKHRLPTGDSTEVLGALEAARQMSRMGEAVHPETRVEWLVKSTRNPFGALITLGRARNNDIILDHPTVSKVHVIFTRAGKDQWAISDERSSNGTFLNGVQLAAGEKRSISDGDNLRFGPDIVARFLEPGSLWHLGRLLRAGRPA